MDIDEARQLGEKAGREDVDNVYNEQGIDALRECQQPGHLDWDEGAINAQAHATDGVPEELREAYYAAYSAAANALANQYLKDAG